MQGGKRNRSAAGPAGGSSLVRDPPAQAPVGRNCGAGELPWSPSPHPPLFQAHHPGPTSYLPRGVHIALLLGEPRQRVSRRPAAVWRGGELGALHGSTPRLQELGPRHGQGCQDPQREGRKGGWILELSRGGCCADGEWPPWRGFLPLRHQGLPGNSSSPDLGWRGLQAFTQASSAPSQPWCPTHPDCSRCLPGHSGGQPGQDPRTPNL